MSESELTEQQKEDGVAELEIENIGGIESTTAEVEPGVTVLAGKNATNRTSFLQAIMAVCGSDNATLKANTDEGRVEMSMGGQTYERSLSRRNGGISFDGDPYLDDSTLADLFAFLLENNEARLGVAQSNDLRELIMRPVDTEEVQREIRARESDRDEIDRELERLDQLAEKLPDLKTEKHHLETQIEEIQQDLEDKQSEFEALDDQVEETRAEKAAYEEKISELNETRNEIRTVEQKIESEQQSLESLQTDSEQWEATLEDLDAVSEDRLEQIEGDLQRFRGQVQGINSTVSELQSILQFNRDFLDDGRPEIVENLQLDGDGDSENVTDGLLNDDEEVVCWTCGSDVEKAQIESTIDQIQSFTQEKRTDRKAIEAQIDELKTEKSTLKDRQREHERAQRKLADIESEIDNREARLEEFTERKTVLEDEAEDLEAEIEALDAKEQSEVLEVHKEINRLEFELGQRKSDLQDTEDWIEEIESELERRENLENERAEVSAKLTSLRTRIEDLQADAIEEFNTHMDAVLKQLGYERIERIWIERTQDEVREGRRKVTKNRFKLHIVRSTESGTVYEDTVDHLSESEREVTGLVFALAGYLVHEVYDHVPFMLLDSLEAIDSARIADLVDYFETFVDYMVVALLEEDAKALDDGYTRIEQI